MKFCQLIECNTRNTFLEKPYTKHGGETSSRPFSRKPKFSISLDQQSEISHCLLLLHVQVKHCLNILKISLWPLDYTSYNAF